MLYWRHIGSPCPVAGQVSFTARPSNPMSVRKRVEKPKPLQNVETYADLISVAKNRSLEPYIKSFVAAPENITQESLGELVGVFSVSDRSEASAYIVNMLASIARKEYFANPRRGAIESFESALHRMNVALAELVKNDQTDWIGSIHGAIAVLEKGNIHFSVTGEGRIFLFRNDALLDISEGLASEDAAMHPLKTFVEISSGRLSTGDCLLLVSPELFELFSESELERNARRLVPEGKFSRFLETAVVNELRIGGAVLVHTEEKEQGKEVTPKRQESRERKTLGNVFSAEAFQKAEEEKKKAVSQILEQSEPLPIPESKKDSRPFGEIYVQGETPENIEEHPIVTKLRWAGEDVIGTIRNTRARTATAVRRALSWGGDAARSMILSGFAAIRARIKASVMNRRREASSPGKRDIGSRIPEETLPTPDTTPLRSRISSLGNIRAIRFPKPKIPTPGIPQVSLPKARIVSFGESARAMAWRWLARIGRMGRISFGKACVGVTAIFRWNTGMARRLRGSFLSLPPKKQLLIAAGSAFAVTLTILGIRSQFSEEEPAPVVITEAAPSAPFPPENERDAILATIRETFPENRTLAPLYLDGKLFIATEAGVVDTESGERFDAPGKVIAASAMDDLDAIFVFTESRELYILHPVTGRFVKNDILLPGDLALRNIGSFLTYTYLLDTSNKQVLRFPRAEGGFGEGKNWLASPAPLDTVTGGAVSENVYLHSHTEVLSFLRGKTDPDFAFEKPATPFTATALCAHPDSPDTFAVLDAPGKRVIVYSREGKILKQLFEESLDTGTSCSLSNDASTVAVSSVVETLIVRIAE